VRRVERTHTGDMTNVTVAFVNFSNAPKYNFSANKEAYITFKEGL